jgi:protoporphyrinogen oxidase
MIVILGGGLAGLSTGYHLGEVPHVVFERDDAPGGLCRSRTVAGFVFDYTGHLLHVRDPRAVALVDSLLPGAFRVVERQARIRTRGVTLPFPFQANLHGLPKATVAKCLVDFAATIGKAPPTDPATSFRDWSLAVFGEGISEAFMFPYNAKLFRRDPSEMTADWVSWAVPKPNLAEVVGGALGVENQGMGYNSTFRYPASGGIGILADALARRVPRLRCGGAVEQVDLDRRTVRLASGETVAWERLVVTVPLPTFLGMTRGGDDWMRAAAADLEWSVVGCLNLGVEAPGIGAGAHWVYFPDGDTPFYRVGFPTNFSDGVAPPGTSSLYVEFGLRRGEPLDRDRLERAALEALRREGILAPSHRVVARDWIRIDPGYVIFDRRRQDAMARLRPALEARGVHLAGRYGAWTYSYMERAILDGMELAARLEPAGAGVAR